MTPNGAGHPILPAKAFHPRKTHSKSRKGCDACKRRKKKCDELSSGCSGCLSNGIVCHYSGTRVSPPRIGRPSTWTPSGISLACVGLPGLNLEENELLHHFRSETVATLGSLSVQQAIASCVPAATEVDFLKHVMCSISASHMVHLTERHDLRSRYHLDKALFAFRQRLSYPITSSQVDAILTSCVLLNVIAFSSNPHRPQDSWLFEGTTDLHWLTVQVGLRSIVFNVRHMLRKSSWTKVYTKDAKRFRGKFRASFDIDEGRLEDMPEGFEEIFNMEQDWSTHGNAYSTALQALVPLLTVDPKTISVTQLMMVVHRFTPNFYQLLRSRDARALLLLAYWLGLMCEVHLWWVSKRARSECFACCRYLDLNGNDTVRGLLSFPAQRCGYQADRPDNSSPCPVTQDRASHHNPATRHPEKQVLVSR
ncbi:MAG: hypothetical protein Q9220_007133 [cf. Caloplaca sp. 1 TL-2023]